MARNPTPDEQKLWNKVAVTATPLNPRQERLKLPTSDAPPPKANAKAAFEIRPFVIGAQAASETAVHRVQHMPAPNMDARAFSKMKRGKFRPEATLDMHGMRAGSAHAALMRFVIESYNQGRRLVLVITGKGKSDAGLGVLRTSTPTWLKQPAVAPMILDFTQAHQKHGGGGAFYIYLRRHRRVGRRYI